MDIIEAFATKNKCYQVGAPLTPRGIMLHSIGTPQPNAAVMARSYNQYQPGGRSVCVHDFIQRDGTYYQTLPYTMRAWHCGGAANATHIGIEMTEPSSIVYTGGASWRDLDPAATEAHVRGTYAAAVELFAQLCTQYALDPLADGVIISHAEGAARGIASAHADPTHLWRAFGLTMDGFRADVAATMAAKNTDEEDDDMVRYDSIDDVPGWARRTIKEMMDAGLIAGTGGGKLGLSDDMLRMLYIMWHMRDTRYGRIVDGKVVDVPAWAQDVVQKLVDDGALAGVGDGKLDLSLDMLRTLAVCQRMMGAAGGGK
nr:MAG TPA: PGRP protein [Caudoviricetes sp.]